jgi:hypothetical protein
VRLGNSPVASLASIAPALGRRAGGDGLINCNADHFLEQESLTMWFTSLLPSLPARAGHRPQTARHRARHRFVPRLEVLEDRTVPSTLTVLNNLDKGAGSLRDAITKASSGDTVVFDPSLNGQTITLTSDQLSINKNLDIEGPGASLLAISGNGTNRVFDVPQGNSVTIAGLTITRGLGNGVAGGGGVLVVGSTLALTNDVLSDNQADFPGRQHAFGGALFNGTGANTTVSGCTFRDNVANGQGSENGYAFGGAIDNGGNGLTVQYSTFIGNKAIGGNGVVGTPGQPNCGVAQGGAIESEGTANTSLTVTHCTFSGNMAIAGNGGSGGNSSGILVDIALGGAIHEALGTLVVSGSTFTNNQALGGSNATGGAASSGYVGLAAGGALATAFGTATITGSTFDCNLAQGGSGNSGGSGSLSLGWGTGGAIGDFFAGTTLAVSNVTFRNNQAVGGAGNGSGLLSGDGLGGGFANVAGATATLSTCTFTGNQATGGVGGSGANGSDGLGGALANIMGLTLTGNILGSTLTVGDCTLTGNMATGGAGAAGGNGGNGFGGGIYNDGQSNLTVTGTGITGNEATGGAAGTGGSAGQGIGGGVYFASGGVGCLDAYTVAKILSNFASTSNKDVFGSYTTC